MKVAGYLRVSTEEQCKDPDASLRTQKETIERYLSHKYPDHQLTLYREEGKSAKDTTGRPVWQRLCRDIELGMVDVLAVQDWDRAFRSVTDAIKFDQFRKDRNIQFISVSNNIDTDTADGWQMFVLVMSFAEKERRKISERVKRAVRSRENRGLKSGGRPTFGFNNKKGVLVIDEHEAEGVKLAFATYLKEGSFNQVSKVLNAAGYLTPVQGKAGGKKWDRASIDIMLSNYAYIGKVEVNRKNKVKDQDRLKDDEKYNIVDAQWNGFISEELFDEVQALIARQRTLRANTVAAPNKENYPYAGGLSYCKCGKRLAGSRMFNGKKHYRYYVCNHCGFTINAEKVEPRLNEVVLKLITENKEMLYSAVNLHKTELDSEIQKIKAEIHNIKRRMKGRTNERKDLITALTKARSEKAITMINAEIEKIPEYDKMDQYQLESLERDLIWVSDGYDIDEIEGQLKDYHNVLDSTLEPYQFKAFVRKIIDKIVIGKESIDISYNIGICKESTSPSILSSILYYQQCL